MLSLSHVQQICSTLSTNWNILLNEGIIYGHKVENIVAKGSIFLFVTLFSKVAAALVNLSDYVYIEMRFLDCLNANHHTSSHQFRQLEIVRL